MSSTLASQHLRACAATHAFLGGRVTRSGGRASSSSMAAGAQPGGGGSARRGVLQLLVGGAAAMLGSRSVAAAAAVDQAEQVGGGQRSRGGSCGAPLHLPSLQQTHHHRLPCLLQVLLDPQWPDEFPFKPEFFQR